jgi:undecaprenyl diphosphate synthase
MIIPQHVGFIMDGNGRWAQARGLPRSAGHYAGMNHIRHVLQMCHDLGIVTVSGYLWSTENWIRPTKEVQYIRSLLKQFGRQFIAELHEKHIRIVHSGHFSGLSQEESAIIEEAIVTTQNNGPFTFNLVFNHGGRAEIVHAAQRIAQQAIDPTAITDQTINAHLYVPNLPNIDVIIRSGGDNRTSNFLIWQSAYADLFVVKAYWPDISKDDLDAAITYYNRRYTSENAS